MQGTIVLKGSYYFFTLGTILIIQLVITTFDCNNVCLVNNREVYVVSHNQNNHTIKGMFQSMKELDKVNKYLIMNFEPCPCSCEPYPPCQMCQNISLFNFLSVQVCDHISRAEFRFRWKELFEWFLASVDSLCRLKSCLNAIDFYSTRTFPPECLTFKGNLTYPPIKLKVLTFILDYPVDGAGVLSVSNKPAITAHRLG